MYWEQIAWSEIIWIPTKLANGMVSDINRNRITDNFVQVCQKKMVVIKNKKKPPF